MIYMPEQIKLILDHANDIDLITSPLKDLNISFFSYTRIYKNGKRIDMNNNAPMAEVYYIKDKLYQDAALEGNSNDIKSGVYVWSAFSEDKSIQLGKNFNVDNGITIVREREDGFYKELWHYASDSKNHENVNFCLNNIHLLRNFEFYFKDRGKKLITLFERNAMSSVISAENTLSEKTTAPDAKKFISEMSVINNFYPYSVNELSFSRRELDCLTWCIEGKTSIEIAAILSISPRTVETHLNSLKRKLNCYKQTNLIKKAFELNIDCVLPLIKDAF